ncbi:MAG: hypothetical protein IJ561_05050, partial [Ruminococcus sp.]|nr:hypothetical protein [Ruminococcus sp.]
MKKTLLTFALAALMLSSCALTYDESPGKERPEDGNVLSVEVEEESIVPVSQIFDGYEELQGKKIGEHIVMPNKIEPCDADTFYTFRVTENTDRSNMEERAITLFKEFFGDTYDEAKVRIDGDERCLYNALPPPPEGEEQDCSDPNAGYYVGYPATIKKANFTYPDFENGTVVVYYPEKDSSVEMELAGGRCTVGEVCQTVQDFIDNEFPGYEGLTVSPTSVYYYDDFSEGDPIKRVYVNCGMVKEG